MPEMLALIVVAMLAYQAGRIGPDPLRPWELKLRHRAFEWRIWWIEEHIRKAEERRVRLLALMREDA